MKKLVILLCVFVFLFSTGFGAKNAGSGKVGDNRYRDAQKRSDALFDKAIAGKIRVHKLQEDGTETLYMITDLPHDEDDYTSYYEVGERIDLDNDGITELVIDGPYGGMYLDVRDGKVYELATGWGTAGVLTHTAYEGTTYICHLDTTHVGREIYEMDAYNGNGEKVKSLCLSAEYEDTGKLDAGASCRFNDKKISVAAFLKLREELFGH